MDLRRIVTGHNPEGRAVVLIDERVTNVTSRRPGHEAAVVWTTEGYPVDNNGAADEAQREVASTLPNGTVFRVISYGPGCAPRRHRTDSIDYAVVLSGAIDMELDDNVTVHLQAGDLLVQRGTIHNWVNNNPEPCVIAFVLIAATPATINGQPLRAQG